MSISSASTQVSGDQLAQINASIVSSGVAGGAGAASSTSSDTDVSAATLAATAALLGITTAQLEQELADGATIESLTETAEESTGTSSSGVPAGTSTFSNYTADGTTSSSASGGTVNDYS